MIALTKASFDTGEMEDQNIQEYKIGKMGVGVRGFTCACHPIAGFFARYIWDEGTIVLLCATCGAIAASFEIPTDDDPFDSTCSKGDGLVPQTREAMDKDVWSLDPIDYQSACHPKNGWYIEYQYDSAVLLFRCIRCNEPVLALKIFDEETYSSDYEGYSEDIYS
jgi:hypothetical protein